jgi:hypothetical protein
MEQASGATHRVKLALPGQLTRLSSWGIDPVDDMQDEQAASELFRRLAQVEEIDMRVGLICERLESTPNDDALWFLRTAHHRAALGDPDGQRVFLALGWAMFDPRVVPRRSMLGAAARREQMHEIADFLTPPSCDDEGAGMARRVPDFGRGRPLTLGERKSLARTHDRSLIQRVVHDPHPDVVRILLDNPSLTEDDVVRICAARPNDREVLQAVYLHRRWVVRYRPRNAILRNPDTPMDTALLLAPLLRKPELQQAATSSELSAAVRLSCKSILAARRAGPRSSGG